MLKLYGSARSRASRCFTMINSMKLDMSPFPNVQRWLATCYARPGYAKYRVAPPAAR